MLIQCLGADIQGWIGREFDSLLASRSAYCVCWWCVRLCEEGSVQLSWHDFLFCLLILIGYTMKPSNRYYPVVSPAWEPAVTIDSVETDSIDVADDDSEGIMSIYKPNCDLWESIHSDSPSWSLAVLVLKSGVEKNEKSMPVFDDILMLDMIGLLYSWLLSDSSSKRRHWKCSE